MALLDYLIRPDKTTATVDLTKESALEATATNVQCILLETTAGFNESIAVDNMITRAANQTAIAVPLKNVFHEVVFKDIWIGNIAEEQAAQYRKKNLEYAIVEWPKITGKVSIHGCYNTATSAWVDYYQVYKGGLVNLKILIERADFYHDVRRNCLLQNLRLLEVWS